MHGMHLNGKAKLLITKIETLAARIETSKLAADLLIAEFTARSTFLLITIFNKKIAKIESSFLTWQVADT